MATILGIDAKLRCSISQGGLVSGVTGILTPKFCIFGDVVNIAINLVNTSNPDSIHVSNQFAEFLDKFSLLSELSSLYTLERLPRYDDGIAINNFHRINKDDDTYWLKKGSMLDLKSRYSSCYKKVNAIIADDRYSKFGYQLV